MFLPCCADPLPTSPFKKGRGLFSLRVYGSTFEEELVLTPAPPHRGGGGWDDCMDAGGRATQDAVAEGVIFLAPPTNPLH